MVTATKIIAAGVAVAVAVAVAAAAGGVGVGVVVVVAVVGGRPSLACDATFSCMLHP